MTNNRISKQEMFMRISEIISERSTCQRTRVGAVITDKELLNIIAIGYNGNYAGGPNVCDTEEPGKCGCLHAEINAIAKVDNTIKNKILFCTMTPCLMCSKLIVNSGFDKVYYRNEYRKTEGIELLTKSNIEVIKI